MLSQGVEAPARPRESGTLLFFSACSSGDASAYSPDVGFVFAVPTGCRQRFELMAQAAREQHAERTGPSEACVR